MGSAAAQPEFDISATMTLHPSRLEYLQTLQLVEFSLAQLDETPLEIEGRLSAAATLAERGELPSAMDLLREALVLTKTMTELRGQGRRHDLLDMRIEAHLRRRLGDLVDPDQLAEQLGDQVAARARAISQEAVAAALGGDRLQTVVRGLLEQRLDAHLREGAFVRAVERLIDLSLRRHLEQEAFMRAAADATARYPERLLKRPETVSRIEAVAVERDRALLGSSRLGDMVGALVDRHAGELIDDPRLAARIELLADRQLQSWLDSSQAHRTLGEAETSEEQPPAPAEDALAELLNSEALLARLDERLAQQLEGAALSERLEHQLREHPGVGRALEDRLRDSEPFADLLEQRSRKLLGRAEFTHRVDHLIRQRCEQLLESQGFRKAVDARAREVAAEQLTALEQRFERRLNERLAKVAQEQRELEQRLELQQRIDERVTELVRKTVAGEVRGLTTKIVPTLVKAALTGDEPVQAELLRLTEEAVKRGVPEDKVVRLVQKELANREALRNAALSGDGLVDQATALARSDAIRAVIEERLEHFKERELARQRQRKSGTQARPPEPKPAPDEPPARKSLDGRGKNTPKRKQTGKQAKAKQTGKQAQAKQTGKRSPRDP